MPPERSYIEFRRERDVNDVLNATFVFLRDEFRGLGLSLLYIVGPVVIVSAFFTAGTQQAAWEGMFNPEAWAAGDDPFEELFTPSYFIGVLLTSIASFLALAVCYSYAMLYEAAGPGPFEPRAVLQRLVQDLGVYLSTSLWGFLLMVGITLLNVILCLGTIAFFVLLFYLVPPLLMVYPARLDRREGFWPALRRCLRMLKGSRWPAFGLLAVTFIVVMIASMAVGLVVAAGFGLITQLVGSGLIAQLFSMVLSLLALLGYLVYALPAVAFVIHYFNLVEQREGVALEARVEQMAREGEADPEQSGNWETGDTRAPL